MFTFPEVPEEDWAGYSWNGHPPQKVVRVRRGDLTKFEIRAWNLVPCKWGDKCKFPRYCQFLHGIDGSSGGQSSLHEEVVVEIAGSLVRCQKILQLLECGFDIRGGQLVSASGHPGLRHPWNKIPKSFRAAGSASDLFESSGMVSSVPQLVSAASGSPPVAFLPEASWTAPAHQWPASSPDIAAPSLASVDDAEAAASSQPMESGQDGDWGVIAIEVPTNFGSAECPTLGSMAHQFGTCRACPHMARGCTNGIYCPFCHLCVHRQRKKVTFRGPID